MLENAAMPQTKPFADMKINIPETGRQRIVIVGGGFAGLNLARKAARLEYDVILIDKNNYHQFQPLFYQVAMSGLEPSSISFPFRKSFQGKKNVFIRVTEVTEVQPDKKRIITPLGHCNYDYLVIAVGAQTNFFGNEKLERLTLPMKSVSEALYLRNTILGDYEHALVTTDYERRQGLVDIVIVGGGPTGVELAGSLAEMRKFVLPKDYPELPVQEEMDIYLIQGAPVLLDGMSARSSQKALEYLEELGVRVLLDTRVTDYDGRFVYMGEDQKIRTDKVIWAAGIRGSVIRGIPDDRIVRGGRYRVDRFNRIEGYDDIFAIGDIAFMTESDFPDGHPQVAQTAIQQGRHLARNFKRSLQGKEWEPFSYKDKGSMATIGRARAVVDLPKFHFNGLLAWLVWLAVHLFSILGARNRLIVFLNWMWNYLNYDQSLRLIIRPRQMSGDGVRLIEKPAIPVNEEEEDDLDGKT